MWYLGWVELGWFVVNEEQGEQESLNQNRITIDIYNVANQMPYRNSHTTPNNIGFLEKQSNIAMKNYSAPSNIKHKEPS